MNKTELLDLITIEDKYALSDDEISTRAKDIATERAIANGWQGYSINKKTTEPIKFGEYLRYEFEVVGESTSIPAPSDNKDNPSSTPSPRIAAKPAEADIL